MEIIHLQYFIAVARYKSFSKAAAASHVSQSVVSKLVKDLEQESFRQIRQKLSGFDDNSNNEEITGYVKGVVDLESALYSKLDTENNSPHIDYPVLDNKQEGDTEDNKSKSQKIINELFAIVTEFNVRNTSYNKTINKTWDELCDMGIDLFQKLKNVDD